MVSKFEKLLQKIKNNPRQVRFEELDKILIRSGFARREPRGGSSHRTYTRDGKMLTVPFRQPHIKSIYVERAIQLLEGGDKS